MSFAPGQFITAQRLNRLQPVTYWAQASAVVVASTALADVPGTSISITVQTNGASAAFWFHGHFYGTGVPASNGSLQAVWDVNSSPTFGVGQPTVANEKYGAGNTWLTTVSTAGTYTFKLKASTSTNMTMPVYTALMVQITEVA